KRFAVVAEADTQERGAHGGAVAGREDATALGGNTEPKLEDRQERRAADAGRDTKQPPAQAAGEGAWKTVGFAAGAEKRLGRQEGVLRTVRAEPLAGQEAVAHQVGK